MTFKALRNRSGLTLEFLAGRLGVTPQAIALWESGRNPIPAKYLVDLANLLGTSVTELLAGGSRNEDG